MVSFNVILSLAFAGFATATLQPCQSNSKFMVPAGVDFSQAVKVSRDIQAAECAQNTRVHGKQTFAIFMVDPSKNKNHGAPYGKCGAFTKPPPGQQQPNNQIWSFFWSGQGKEQGTGAGCIRDPHDGTCGCENSDGSWQKGQSNCQ